MSVKSLSLVLLFQWAISGFSPEASGQTVSGQIVEMTIPAPALANNLLGDPTTQPLSIYLPPSYSSSTNTRYPVIYLLHGFNGTNRTWMIDPTNVIEGPLADSLRGTYTYAGLLDVESLDAVFALDIIPEVILVARNGRNAYKHSFYINSEVAGNWEDYIVDNVVEFIDERFRTLGRAASRGIAGHSGGANGALYLAMRHPDVFGSVYAMAPCCSGPDFSLPSLRTVSDGSFTEFWQQVFGSIENLSSTADLPAPRFGNPPIDFYINVELAASAAYSPNPDNPPLFADQLLEFNNDTLVANESAMERRLEKSIYHMIEDHEQDLRSLNGILVDYGELEIRDLAAGNALFAAELGRRGIPFELEVYAKGNHGNMIADRMIERGFRFFSAALEFDAE